MDKREYQEKLDEINRLIAVEDYAQAARVADTIDWKRVRNVQTLVMVSEIYEAVERYEDSKVLLLRAYRRSPLGRTVLYRLVECTIHLGQFDEAIEYYSEYVQAAPHDNNKYILKYKIYKGRGSSLDEQIDILKEYLEQEYTEKWVYELAKLQIQADRVQEGLSTCDDLVLWFHSGKYVIKALELKKKYAPLTPKQQEIYDNRFNEEEEEEYTESGNSYLKEAQMQALAEKAAAQQEAIKSELAEDISHAAQMEKAKEELSQKAQAAQKAVDETAAQSEKVLADKADEIVAEAGITEPETGDVPEEDEPDVKEAPEMAPVSAEAEDAPEETASEEETAAAPEAEEVPEETSEEEPAAEAEEAPAQDEYAQEIEAVAAEAVASAQEEPEQEESEEEISEEQLQEDMVRSMREIVSGVGPRNTMDEEEAALDQAIEQSKEDQENAVAARGADRTFSVPQSAASQKRTAGKLTIDDILLSMGEQGERVREVTGNHVMSADEEAQIARQEMEMPAAEETPVTEEAPAAEEVPVAEEAPETEDILAAEEPKIPGFLHDEVKEARQTAEIPVEDIVQAQEAAQAAAEAEEETVREEVLPQQQEELASLPPVSRVEYTEEIASAKTKKLPVEEIRKLHEAFLADGTSGAAALAAQKASEAAEKAAEMAEAEAAAASGMAVIPEEEDGIVAPDVEETVGNEEEQIAADAQPVTDTAPQQEEGSAEAGPDIARQEEAESADAEAPAEEAPVQEERTVSAAGGVQETVEVPKSAEEPKIYGSRPMLQEYQKDLFRGFIGIGSLEEQIANAIQQAEGKQGDRTSRSGNILILGGHGCGKTTIATGIAKAIAEDKGTHSIKMARIYAADLNRKDIAATIAKIAGGMLIIEEAGDLDDAIVDQLTTAMEFRTDGLIVILEDEQRYIHDLLMRHPRFTMKFTAQIYIPQYSNEDLVNFGSIYAQSKDYVFSDKALAAFYDRIEAASQNGDVVSITNVVELVDRGIKNANKFFRRIGSSRKRYDEMDRVILKEKDFR
ncbi:MAG: hypothetical protein II640_00675 [Lachnospiraceae bacterium]|nr:hypothetical protein [Lachnospiraceae bacterium]